jgi:NADPH-dependent F420 reductase
MDALEASLEPLAEALSNKLVISVVASLSWGDGRPRPVLPQAGSAAQMIQKLLPESQVTSGFQTLSAEKLSDLSTTLNEDCIVCGDDKEARDRTMELARSIEGIRPISGGRLEWSIYPELMVGLLATINRIHKVHAGIQLVGFRDH